MTLWNRIKTAFAGTPAKPAAAGPIDERIYEAPWQARAAARSRETTATVAKAPDEVRRLQALLRSPDRAERDRARAELAWVHAGGAATPVARPAPCREAVVLVLDRSASMGTPDYPPNRLEAAKAAAREFLSIKAGRTPEDLVAIVGFHEEAHVVSGFRTAGAERAALEAALGALSPYDGTDIAAGLVTAEGLFAGVSRIAPPKLLQNPRPRRPPHGPAPPMKAHGVVIDVVGIGGSPADVNEASLRQVASVVDGVARYRFIRDWHELVAHFRRLADRIVR